MQTAPTPRNEEHRLKTLESYQLLDSGEEAIYDAFVKLASDVCDAPMSMISLIDRDRQWFKARIGVEEQQLPRDTSFCGHAIMSSDLFEVADANRDERFVGNPFVEGSPHVRFYAGVPLEAPNGDRIGMLCVIDQKPRELNNAQRLLLQDIARLLMETIEGRKRLLETFDTSEVDLYIVNIAGETLNFVSRGAAKRLGYSQQELLGRAIGDVFSDSPLRDFASISERLAHGEDVEGNLTLKRRDGTLVPVEFRAGLSSSASAHPLMVIAAFDISTRVEREAQIRLLTSAMQQAGDAIMIYGVTADGALHTEYMNHAAEVLTGYDRREVIGKTLDWLRQQMPDDEGMRTVRDAVLAGRAVSAQIVSYRNDGSSFWNHISLQPICDNEGAVTHWISVERDISEDVARTAQLEEEHDRLLALTKAARTLFAALDARSVISVLGKVATELLHAHTRVFAQEEGTQRVVAVDELGALAADQDVEDRLIRDAIIAGARLVDTRRDRAVAYAGRFAQAHYAIEVVGMNSRSLSATDLSVFDLLVEYFAVAARNVMLYRELDERRAAVMDLNQTKSDLIAMLAHDFRGPLTSIVGFADLVAEVEAVNDDQREFLETIKRSALQLSELAADTLTLSRLERNEVPLQLSQVHVAGIISDVVAQYADRRDVNLSVKTAHDDVIGDTDRLRQVFSNLIDNAIKYSPNGQAPSVKVDVVDDNVVVSIADTGIGIPHSELATVFDRFSRASNAKKLRISGTGFGLFMTKQLVALHGGTISVESQEGQGSCFTVTLPRRAGATNAPRSVLILDASRQESYVAYGLREAGYRVTSAGSLEEIFMLVDTDGAHFIIVTDDSRTLNSGRAVQLRAYAREHEIPLLAIGSEHAARLNAVATFARPVLVADIIGALDRLGGQPVMRPASA